MKIAALQISVGDYTAKTGVIQKDEIGELASAMDDMSDKLEAAAQEQMKLDKLRRDFIANISHELRTPVTVIRGSLEAICNGVVSDAGKVTEYHNQMLSESDFTNSAQRKQIRHRAGSCHSEANSRKAFGGDQIEKRNRQRHGIHILVSLSLIIISTPFIW